MILRTLSLIRKEFLHIFRDPRTLAVMFLMPIVQLVLLGYAATTDIEHLHTAVLDGDRSAASRELIEAYRGTVSLPFAPGGHKRIAVKIVDDRGIESLKVLGIE